MASEDGSLTIKVKLDASGVESGLEKVKKKTKEVGEEAERSGEKTKEPLEEIPKEVPKTTSALDKLKAKIAAVGDKMKTLQPAASKLASGIGTAAKAGAAALATAAASATAGIVAVGKQALDSYAQYEQMVGGIDKLFGTGPAQTLDEYAESVGKSAKSVEGEFNKLTKASQTVQKNAQNAFKTAGMSANSYMESVTGFSAALINSLGGDTQKAANMADVAMRSISDNANTFGTDTQNLVETYQSLAKGNYAMLDNLKLGYGGTKTELERMMKDANEYAAQNKDIAEEVGVNGKLQVSSFADIVAAIELMQRKQGIAGTTAREAATTIEGSVNMAKAAWENWVTELGKDDADVSARTDELVDSVVTAASNIIPRMATIAKSIGSAIGEQIPRVEKMLAKSLSEMDFGDMLKNLERGASSIADGISDLVAGIDWTGVASTVGDGIADVVSSAADYIDENGAEIVAGAVNVAGQVADGIIASAPKVLSAVVSITTSVGNAIASAGIAAELAADESLQAVLQATEKTGKAVEESAEAWDKSRDACTEAGDAAAATYEHYEGLMDRLDGVTTASGKVKEGHEEEARLIASTLNDALGTNISIRDGVISKYKEEKKKLEELIEAKKAEALSEAYADQYKDAIKGKADALKNYSEAQNNVSKAQKEYNDAVSQQAELEAHASEYSAVEWDRKNKVLQETTKNAKSALDSAQETYDTAKSTYTEMEGTVSGYEKAQAKLNKGDYSGAVQGFEGLASSAKHSAQEIDGMASSDEKLAAMSENVTAYADQMSLAVGDTANEIKTKLKKSLVEFAKSGGDVSKALAEGVKNSKGEVQLSAKEVRKALKSGLTPDEQLKVLGTDSSKKYADGVKSGKGKAKSAGKANKDAAVNGMKGSDAAAKAGKDAAAKYSSGVSSGKGSASSSGHAVASAAGSAMKSNNSSASGWGSDLASNFARGISGAVDTVKSAAQGVANAVYSLLHHSVPDEGPLKTDDVWGKHLAENIADGILQGIPTVTDASAQMAQGITTAVKSATDGLLAQTPSIGKKTERQLSKTDKALDKLAKQMGKKAKAASEKQYKDVYKAAKSGLEKVEKKHSVSYRQQADYWAKVGKKAKDGSALQEKCYAKMAKAAEKYAASLTLGEQKAYYADLAAAQEKQAAATEKSYKAEEKRVKALKKAAEAAKSGSSEQKKLKAEYDKANESLKKQETRLKSQKERLSDTKEELKDVRKQIKEAAADAKDAFLGVEETSTKSLKDIKEELADTIADLQQQYQDAVQATADSITGSLDIFKEFASESTGSAETLIANMRSQAQATDDYKAVIEDLKAKVESGQISQTLFDELAAKGIDSLADLKTVNSMTESQLKEYAELFEKTRQDALNASKTLNEDLYKDTQDKIAKAKDDALAEALKSYQAYEAKLKELGKKVSKTVEKQYKDDQAAMDALAATGKDKLTELAESYAKAFGDDILEQTKGYEQYTTSAMEAAAKATEDSVKKQEETVKTGTTLITKTVQTAMDTQYAAVSGTMSSMESSVASTVSRIQSMMAEINSIQAAANARESSVSSQLASARASAARQSSKASAQSAAQGSPVVLSMPTAPQVNWYAAGGIFNSPQVIGIGEQGTEFALRDYHLDAIAERMGSTQQADFDRAISRLVNALPGIIKKSTPDSLTINKREFGRLVREV